MILAASKGNFLTYCTGDLARFTRVVDSVIQYMYSMCMQFKFNAAILHNGRQRPTRKTVTYMYYNWPWKRLVPPEDTKPG